MFCGSFAYVSSVRSYQNRISFSPATEARSRPGWRLTFLLVQESKQRTQTRLSASLRYVSLRYGQTCVTPFSLRCGKTHCAPRRSVQTRCRKSDVEATLSCGSVARSLNRVPQAQTHGWMRERTA